MRIDFRPAVETDAEAIINNLREIDRIGVHAWGVDPIIAMRANIRESYDSTVGLLDGEIACAWGITGSTLMGSHGLVWMLTTDKADKAAFRFARYSQRMIDSLFTVYPTLYGFVDTENTRSQKWLKWLGFKLGEPVMFSGRVAYSFAQRRK